MNDMQNLHNRITAAVKRSVEAGQSEREAFASHMRCLIEQYPNVAAAYTEWLRKYRVYTKVVMVDDVPDCDQPEYLMREASL